MQSGKNAQKPPYDRPDDLRPGQSDGADAACSIHAVKQHGTETDALADDRFVRRDTSRLEVNNIFRELILNEIRDGRLTAARRRRIVRYAARLGLTAVEAGELIAKCCEEILQSGDETHARRALRLVEPAHERIPGPYKMTLVIAAVLAADLLLLRWVW